MVTGIDTFREHFQGYEDCYTIIGGTACDILMAEADLDFRATKDIDLIVLIENRFEEFATLFWKYIESGGYRCGWRSSPELHFYRFTEPAQRSYPTMIELFSRHPDFILNDVESVITPLPVSDEIASLSAILLDDDYYRLMIDGRREVDGVSVLDADYLITFKAKAYLDLGRRKLAGEHVNDRDYKKHKNDVFRLYSIIEPDKKILLPESIRSDMSMFITGMEREDVELDKLGLAGTDKSEVISVLKNKYL